MLGERVHYPALMLYVQRKLPEREFPLDTHRLGLDFGLGGF